ncbi:MAG: hypothetical protein IJQ28_06980 [Clostridia bacterium]|nr:hypothetical protein [Clostridia bacterium]
MDDFQTGGGLWLFAILALMWGGGFGGFGNAGFANAIGYQNLATQNDVQRGFDNQNSMANQREILGAVTNGTAQAVAATNQAFHDNLNVIQDKYGELTRDIYGVSGQIAQVLANQNECCCSTKMLIQENAAQNRYDGAMNTQKILDALAQNKIEALQGRIAQLELQQATQNTVKYPTNMTYTAGTSPFCNCNSCGCYA